MGAEGDFAAQAVAYMRVYAICSPITTIVFAMDNFLRICGIIRGSMLFKYSDVGAERRAGIYFPRRSGLGHLGSRAGHLFRYAGLRSDRADAVSAREKPFCASAVPVSTGG